MKAVVFSLGCKVNECESDSLISGLIELGYEVSDKLEYADLYIVNTCAVTKEAEKKSRQTVSRINGINKNAKIIFTGCASEKCPSSFIGKKNVSLVTGTFKKSEILNLLNENGIKVFPHDNVFDELKPVKSLRERAFIKVQDGCDNFCSYCVIPYLRGRSRSRSIESIINEIKSVNAYEVVLTGINLTAYNYNGLTLKDLILKLSEEEKRIRLGSLEENVIDEEFLSALKNLKNFAPHFHLSLQSGSNAVLKKMNRHYNREDFIKSVNLIKKYFPNAGITTDVIVGFPTETEEDFFDTLSLIDQVGFSDIHPFIFSAREGTVAYKFKEIPYPEKKARLNVLLEKKKSCKSQFVNKMINSIDTFLFEEVKDGFSVGYLGNYLRIYCKDKDVKKGFNKVKIIKEYKDGAIAELIK